MRFFIFGAGFSAGHFAREAKAFATVLGGTTRDAEKAARLERTGIPAYLFDGNGASGEVRAALRETTHLVVSAGPNENGDPVLNGAGDLIRTAMPALSWIGYLSTIGVYGDHGGAWVDEEAETRAASARSRRRVEAENAWLALGAETGVPVAVLRLSGIYGPGRNAFVNLQNGTARRVVKEGQIFNRIHVADISGALEHLARPKTGGVFNVSDDEPAPPQDVVTHAANLMGVAPPQEIPFAEADMSPMALSFWGEVKRVSNARLKATGYDFRYPDYRAALSDMWTRDTWKAP